MKQELIINSTDLASIAQACNTIRSLHQPADPKRKPKQFRLTIVQYRGRRSDAQNRLYWVGYVQPFGDYLRAQGNDHFTDEMAHEVLKHMFLQQSAMNADTGEAYTYVRSTTSLNPDEFTDYLEKVGAFLATECGMKGYGSNRQTLEQPA